jgi:hypothetical protein
MFLSLAGRISPQGMVSATNPENGTVTYAYDVGHRGEKGSGEKGSDELFRPAITKRGG